MDRNEVYDKMEICGCFYFFTEAGVTFLRHSDDDITAIESFNGSLSDAIKQYVYNYIDACEAESDTIKPMIESLLIAKDSDAIDEYSKKFAKLGGSAKTKKKAEAARENGKKGGRPKKRSQNNE